MGNTASDEPWHRKRTGQSSGRPSVLSEDSEYGEHFQYFIHYLFYLNAIYF